MSVSDLLNTEKRLDWKDKVSLKFHGVTTWLTNNYNTYISQ